MDFAELVGAALTLGLVTTGIAVALGLGAGDSVAQKRHGRRVGPPIALIGGAGLATDLTRWDTLPPVLDFALWVLSVVFIGSAIYLLVQRPAETVDLEE